MEVKTIHWDKVNLMLSTSQIATFMECRKKYQYQYKRHIFPTEKPASLGFGSAVHKGLEMLFTRLREFVLYPELPFNPCALQRFRAECCAVTRAEATESGLTAENIEKAVALIGAYCDRYVESDVANYDILSIEAEFNEPLRNPDTGRVCNRIRMCGFADGIVRSKSDGHLYILEHKTAGIVNEAYIDRISIDWQIAIYAYFFSQVYGEPIVGAIYDVLRKPAIRMSAGTAKKPPETIEQFRARLEESITDETFIRHAVIFDPDETREFLRELWGIAREIEKCRCFPKCTGNCLKYGACPYLALCKAGGRTDRVPDGLYETRISCAETEVNDED